MFHQRGLVSHKHGQDLLVTEELPTREFKQPILFQHAFLPDKAHSACGRRFVHTVTTSGFSIAWNLICLLDSGVEVSAKAFDPEGEVVDKYKKRWVKVKELPKNPSLLVYLHPEIDFGIHKLSSDLGTLVLARCHNSSLIVAPADIRLVLVEVYNAQGISYHALPVPSPDDV